jgi:Fe-S oxidoreductase
MCPSYRVTRDEQHLTRGRANTLRLALSGQLPRDAFTSPDMYDTMKLCVGCKGCKRECPVGVDMAKMKIEFLAHYHRRHGLPLRDRLIAYLPRYAPYVRRVHGLANLRNRSRALARLGERVLGLSARRPLPAWHARPFADAAEPEGSGEAGEVVLFADTFNRYFEPDNLDAALNVLKAAGLRVHRPVPADGTGRPLCCGRTFLAAGLVDEARFEARRTLATLRPFVEKGVPVIGLEPSCLLTFRDELASLLPKEDTAALVKGTKLFEEFLVERKHDGKLDLNLKSIGSGKVMVHGHCHQKAFGVMHTVTEVLQWIPGLDVQAIATSCCGMAGAFGYNAETYDVSMRMAELNLAPAVRDADAHTRIVADGTSCRHQIADTTGRQARHAACILNEAL